MLCFELHHFFVVAWMVKSDSIVGLKRINAKYAEGVRRKAMEAVRTRGLQTKIARLIGR